ncbi:NAD-dependent epimerase/dehydratase family protein [Nonomuraea mesophila]|uniref:NAD-dependent epimerase/dehydratase family protein n=1 Tax=Nonomuraea mesophila TaxID=2530382 RepID=A0A4R5ECL6_9ACTN|nr:NAD-dependent epimerase/dehydratase family protein [Nonomuraea mesophila]TDE31058.1 NAD-dependent epimerase/dehydratase family protein [Nonomuraea mesophila]
MRLTGAVMAHPRRREAAARLAGDVLDVVTDPDPGGRPSAFRTSLLAWSSIPEHATHHVLLHDDMALSGGFLDRAARAAQAMPGAALALFAFWNSRNGAAVRMGALAGARWVRGAGEYTPVAALLLPRHVAAGYVEWARDKGGTWPDDVLMGRYLRQAGVPVYVAVPSLAEHEDLASLVDNDFQGVRRSPCFFADDPPADAGEDRVLDRLPVIPFLKRGVAQCAVRVPGTGRWRDLRCDDHLAGLGIDAGALRARAGAGPHFPLWLTAYTMGVVHRGPRGDARLVDEALATLGPGGLCHELGARELARLWPELHDVARAGLEAGLEAGPEAGPEAGLRAGSALAPPGVPAPPVVQARQEVAVTGAATFVRQHVADVLTDRGFRLSGGEAGVVVHVCALGWDTDADPEEEVRLARAAFAGGRGGVLLSSSRVYPARTWVDEETPVEPADTPLARALLAVESAAPGAVVLRLGEPYGPGMPQRGAVADLVLRSSLNRPGSVHGPPAQLVHVRDVAQAVLAALEKGVAGRVYNIAGRRRRRMRELADAVSKAVRPVRLETSESPGGPLVNVERAGVELGWRAEVTLDYGLHTFAQWLAYESDRA